MSKKISVTELRNRLGSLLTQLEEGHSHFVVERNNHEVAVLLSIEKFRDIMQTLETLNSLEFIEGEKSLTLEEMSFPILGILSDKVVEEAKKAENNVRPNPNPSAPSSLEDVAAKLGIRILK